MHYNIKEIIQIAIIALQGERLLDTGILGKQ